MNADFPLTVIKYIVETTRSCRHYT